MALVRTGAWAKWALVSFVALAASVVSGPVLADNAFSGLPGVADARGIDRDIQVYLAQAKSDDLLLMEPTPAAPAPAGKSDDLLLMTPMPAAPSSPCRPTMAPPNPIAFRPSPPAPMRHWCCWLAVAASSSSTTPVARASSRATP